MVTGPRSRWTVCGGAREWAASSHLNPWAKEASVKLLTRYWQKAEPADGFALSSMATRAWGGGRSG